MADLIGIAILLVTAGALLVAILTAIFIRDARRPPRHTVGYAIARGLDVDPAEAGWSHESWTLDRPGADLPVWDIEGLDGSGPTIVMLHGWGMSRIDMLERADFWRERGRRLVLFDARGHGEAEGLSPLGAGEGADVVDLLERLDDDRIVLVGHSMGATVALEAASLNGSASRVAGMVLFGAYADLPASIRRRMRHQGFPSWPMIEIAMLWYRLNGLRFPSIPDAAAKAPCPVLIIHGEQDPICSPTEAEHLAEVIPDARLWNAEGAGHLDAHEVNAERHGLEVDTFLAHVRGLDADRASPIS